MERYIRTQSSPPGPPTQPPRQQPPSAQASASPPACTPTHSPPNYTPTSPPPPSSSSVLPSQVRPMKKVPSNASMDPVITQAKMVALQSKYGKKSKFIISSNHFLQRIKSFIEQFEKQFDICR